MRYLFIYFKTTNNKQTNKQTASLLSHWQTAMTTYNEAVCHAGQHKERVYTMLIWRHVTTHTKRSDMGSHSFTCKLHHACLLFCKRSPDAPLLCEMEDICSGLAAHLSTLKGWKAELGWLVDLYRMAYPHKWLPIGYRWKKRLKWLNRVSRFLRRTVCTYVRIYRPTWAFKPSARKMHFLCNFAISVKVKREGAKTHARCNWRLCTPRQPFSTAMTGARYCYIDDVHDSDCCTPSQHSVGCM